MFNQTLFLNTTKTFAENSWAYIKGDFINRCFEVIGAPFKNPDMLWMLLPLIATIIFLEFYFGRYKDEELGWNTAYGNALVLAFIAIDLFRHTFGSIGKPLKEVIMAGDAKIIISLGILCFALLILFINFFHSLPKKIAYIISSPAYLNFIALLGIIIVYSDGIPLDWTTLWACIVMLLLFTLLAHIIYLLVPSYTPPLKRIMEQDGKKKESKKKSKKEKKKAEEEPKDEEDDEDEDNEDDKKEDEDDEDDDEDSDEEDEKEAKKK